MGLGQESDREGEVVSWEAASSAPGHVAMKCQKVLFAAIAQNFGREGLHIMTASMRLVHESCGTGRWNAEIVTALCGAPFGTLVSCPA